MLKDSNKRKYMQKFSKPQYINWIIKENGIVFEDNVPLNSYRIDYDNTREDVLNEWAEHIRKHYISDELLEKSVSSLHLTKKEYLSLYCIPQKCHTRGPSTISTEWAEILVYDLIEYILNYIALRGRHWNKATPTAPVQGSDVLGAKMTKATPSSDDELFVIEVKASLSKCDYSKLIKAKKDSDNDTFRHAISLNFMRIKYLEAHEDFLMSVAERFQQKANSPFKVRYGAVAIVTQKEIENNTIAGINGLDLNIRIDNEIFLIHGDKLMDLAYNIYERIIK